MLWSQQYMDMGLVVESLEAAMPHGWSEHRCEEGDLKGHVYYFNEQTQESLWEHPMDHYFRSMLAQVGQPGHPCRPTLPFQPLASLVLPTCLASFLRPLQRKAARALAARKEYKDAEKARLAEQTMRAVVDKTYKRKGRMLQLQHQTSQQAAAAAEEETETSKAPRIFYKEIHDDVAAKKREEAKGRQNAAGLRLMQQGRRAPQNDVLTTELPRLPPAAAGVMVTEENEFKFDPRQQIWDRTEFDQRQIQTAKRHKRYEKTRQLKSSQARRGDSKGNRSGEGTDQRRKELRRMMTSPAGTMTGSTVSLSLPQTPSHRSRPVKSRRLTPWSDLHSACTIHQGPSRMKSRNRGLEKQKSVDMGGWD